jgi:ribosomal protein S18 acetylase RimI-like enzyme
MPSASQARYRRSPMDASHEAELTIRLARVEDIPAVLALWKRARSPVASTPDDHDSIARLIEHTADGLLVAENQGRVVGALVAAWDGWRGNMYRLAVLPEKRRCGIARRLVQAGHERLRAKGAKRVTALVAHGETDATALWRAVDYEHDEYVVRFVRNL